MLEPIALIVLICSLIGMGAIVFRKMPLILDLPESPSCKDLRKNPFQKVKISLPIGKFSYRSFLQKILSRVRVLTLKTDKKTSTWLQELRKESQKNSFKNNGDYWPEVKKFKKKSGKPQKKNSKDQPA